MSKLHLTATVEVIYDMAGIKKEADERGITEPIPTAEVLQDEFIANIRELLLSDDPEEDPAWFTAKVTGPTVEWSQA